MTCSRGSSSTPARAATCATTRSCTLDKIGEPWREIVVAGDIELEREYGERLPVIMLDGKEHGYFRVEADRLMRDLAAG